MPYKQPYSVLVVVHTTDKQVLLIERADFANGWQSVTGSREDNEDWRTTAIRELAEETGLNLTQGELVDWEIENQDVCKRGIHMRVTWEMKQSLFTIDQL